MEDSSYWYKVAEKQVLPITVMSKIKNIIWVSRLKKFSLKTNINEINWSEDGGRYFPWFSTTT